ncbi:MAG: DUF2809 domain-containing protein [Armatimonadetes bacterium]|nr:DUF2809 domain-containing protein [Armatimonadota bacterium]
MVTSSPARSRPAYAAFLVGTILLGLASRRFSHWLPWWLAKNAGDILYATMTFWLAGLLFPRLPTGRAAVAALLFCVVIEFAKLIQTPGLVAARRTTAGHLALGSGFHVSNLVCYGIGILLATGIEIGTQRQRVQSGPNTRDRGRSARRKD